MSGFQVFLYLYDEEPLSTNLLGEVAAVTSAQGEYLSVSGAPVDDDPCLRFIVNKDEVGILLS